MSETTSIETHDPSVPETPLVLLVDDEVNLADELAEALLADGIECHVANCAPDALEILTSHPEIAVIVTDVRMPGQGGFQLSRQVMATANPALARRIIIMTGHATLNDAAEAVSSGVFDYLRKPFSVRSFLSAVTRAMQSALDERKAFRQAESERVKLVQAATESEHMRMRDRVTGLPNGEALAAAIAKLGHDPVALLMLRLEGLSLVADVGGRKLREDLLAAAAERLRTRLGMGHLYAPGDAADFAVLLPDCSEAAAHKVAETLLATLDQPLVVGDQSFPMTVSIGLTSHGIADTAPLDVRAVVAMAAAGRQGGGGVVTFTAAMHEAALNRLRIAQDLPLASSLGQLSLNYQPLVRPDRSALVGFEALMQWQHPELGRVSPTLFIAIAEETGVISALGDWAIRTAAAQVATWWRGRDHAPYISVNVSGRQLRDTDVPAAFTAAFAEHGLPPKALVAEVTETFAMSGGAVDSLTEIRQRGVRVALDDFGAGYSSLGALRSVPADIIKFDRALLPVQPDSVREERFFNSLVEAVGGLGLAVLAEGIETEDQLKLAREAGCYAVQGYHLWRPMPADKANALVAGWGAA